MAELTKQENIAALTKLKRMGVITFKGNLSYTTSNNVQITCPYHKDKAPSLRIELNRGVWYCHSCHRQGNINTLCLQKVHMTVRDFLGIASPFDFTTPSYHYTKPSPPEFPALLIKGFTSSALDIRSTYNYLNKRKIIESIVISMNMMYTPECTINGSFFKERLIIPMYNKNNELINAECRSLNPEINYPKVLYPKNTAKPLFEEYKLDRQKPLYLVEGLMDLARLREDSRFSNSTATFGTGLSEYQTDILIEFDKLILIPDNDNPGVQFAQKLKEEFKDKFSILKIKDDTIKDVGDIPISIPEFYNNKGFIEIKQFSY